MFSLDVSIIVWWNKFKATSQLSNTITSGYPYVCSKFLKRKDIIKEIIWGEKKKKNSQEKVQTIMIFSIFNVDYF